MAKLITVSENLLEDILPHLKDTPLEKKITDLIENTSKYQTQNITFFPKVAKVDRIVDGKNVSMELARLGMAQVVVYQHKKPFIYQEQLLKVQDEAKQKKLGIWGL